MQSSHKGVSGLLVIEAVLGAGGGGCHQHDIISERAAFTYTLGHAHLHLCGFNSFPLRLSKNAGDGGMDT